MKMPKKLLDGIPSTRHIVYAILVFCILVFIIISALFTRRATRAEDGCLPLFTFNDGSRLWLCPSNVEPDNIAFKQQQATPTLKATQRTVTKATATATATFLPIVTATFTATATVTVTGTLTPTLAGPTNTPAATTPAVTPTPPAPGATFAPWPDAPLCLDVGEFHNVNLYHGIWNATDGCHYNHEHGDDAFTPAMRSKFPDLQFFLGGVQIGHTNPSSSIENVEGGTGKHGGNKWYADDDIPQRCAVGFEGGTVGARAVAMQFHSFARLQVELEPRIHSAVIAVQQCKPGDPNDVGLFEVVQLVDYGQVRVPYQGDRMPYPNAPVPSYGTDVIQLAPYISSDCIGVKVPPQIGACRPSRQEIINRNSNTNSTWTNKSGFRVAPSGSKLIAFLFRVRDAQSVFDWRDLTHPFSFIHICSNDGGTTFAASRGCRWDNSTGTPHELQVTIPASWDNLAGFDTDAEVGRVTADGFVTKFGELAPAASCLLPSTTACFPIHMVRAFVGFMSSELSAEKVSNPTPDNTPDDDVFFCGNQVCQETDPGAQSSGWIGPNN